MTAWVENLSGDGSEESNHVYKICARELQNFDGVHQGIKIVSNLLILLTVIKIHHIKSFLLLYANSSKPIHTHART